MRVRSILGATVLVAATVVTTTAAGVGPSAAAAGQTYLVVFKAQAVPSGAASMISGAGGTVVASYNAIGVVVAQSSAAAFATSVGKDARVEGVAATASFATRLVDAQASSDAAVVATPAPGNDSLSGLQWDMIQIHAPEARAINGGSRTVVVGDIDTGLDYTHPDLAANVDFANSVSCVGGTANTNPAAWNDDNGHGTHTAGTIAAAKNGIGIVGVAPNVKIAAIKAGNAAGFFFP
jgi:lantibiotic leader peptide-processing serine protease